MEIKARRGNSRSRGRGSVYNFSVPVVIYGEGEKAKFPRLVHRISLLPIPLPFGALTARRSVLSIENLNLAVAAALTNPRARGETFIVSDPTPVTVGELIVRHRKNLGKPPRLIAVPERWIKWFLKVIGQGSMWERIGCDLVAYPRKFLAAGWEPLEPPLNRSSPF